ncbi:MAG: hypothetical protein HY074_18985 [Deltaproteobacteria bacterium]|nr:hypothetical protein [Deltaproteobacteria bacterium]
MDAAEVFQAADFKSVRFVVTFQNVTTRTEIREKEKISLIEIAERSILLEIPGKSCSPRHSVLIRIERPTKRKLKAAVNADTKRKATPDYELLFDATGKVVSVEDTGDSVDKVLIDLVQFDIENWRRFMEVFSSRQDDIEKFFSAAKG